MKVKIGDEMIVTDKSHLDCGRVGSIHSISINIRGDGVEVGEWDNSLPSPDIKPKIGIGLLQTDSDTVLYRVFDIDKLAHFKPGFPS